MVGRSPLPEREADRIDFYSLRRGDVLPPLPVPVSVEDVRAYLDATGEAAERWRETVPPLALGAFVFGALLAYMPLPDGAVHVSQDFEFTQALTAGEPAEAHVSALQRSERQGAVVVVFGIELRVGGRLVLQGRATVMAPARTEA